ncbi:MAG: glycogen/starch synthase [Sandaracinus sp.]|nr:glycogen/starch synthase [Sandaracinus sp.]
MHALFVTTEVSPYLGRTAAAEVCGALPKGLRSLGHAVSVMAPLHRSIDPSAHALARRLSKIEVEVDGERFACEMYTGRTVSGVDLIFLGHEDLFRNADDFEGEGFAKRLAVFARAAAYVITEGKLRFDVVHGHDLAGALTLAHLAAKESPVPRVLNLHRGPSQLPVLGPEHAETLGVEGPALEAGLDAAVRTLVASETFAGTLRSRFPRANVIAIPSGIDASVWNPLTDPHLPSRFDPVDTRGKARGKESLQRELGLPVRADVPLIFAEPDATGGGTLSRLVKITSELLRNDVQMAVLLGDAHADLVAAFEELAQRWPDRIQVRAGHDDAFRHRVLGAADLAAIAPDDAPAGSSVMRAHRYGVVPVARSVGALADLVVDCDARLVTGTGLLFEGHDPDELLSALRRGIAAFSETEAFARLRERVMRVDHSWDRAARLYEGVYRELTTPA